MADNNKCSGNCLNCSPAQRTYCASQHAYSNMMVLDTMMGVVMGLKDEVKALSEKMDNDVVFDPKEIAQKRAGASEVPSNN